MVQLLTHPPSKDYDWLPSNYRYKEIDGRGYLFFDNPCSTKEEPGYVAIELPVSIRDVKYISGGFNYSSPVGDYIYIAKGVFLITKKDGNIGLLEPVIGINRKTDMASFISLNYRELSDSELAGLGIEDKSKIECALCCNGFRRDLVITGYGRRKKHQTVWDKYINVIILERDHKLITNYIAPSLLLDNFSPNIFHTFGYNMADVKPVVIADNSNTGYGYVLYMSDASVHIPTLLYYKHQSYPHITNPHFVFDHKKLTEKVLKGECSIIPFTVSSATFDTLLPLPTTLGMLFFHLPASEYDEVDVYDEKYLPFWSNLPVYRDKIKKLGIILDKNINKIGFHLLTEDGRVFVAGYNKQYSLGLSVPTTELMTKWKELEYDEPIKDIIGTGEKTAGMYHLTESGKLYYMGYNKRTKPSQFAIMPPCNRKGNVKRVLIAKNIKDLLLNGYIDDKNKDCFILAMNKDGMYVRGDVDCSKADNDTVRIYEGDAEHDMFAALRFLQEPSFYMKIEC